MPPPALRAKPTTVLGRSCVDTSRLAVGDKRVVGGGSAQRKAELYETSFGWTVPSTMPPPAGPR